MASRCSQNDLKSLTIIKVWKCSNRCTQSQRRRGQDEKGDHG